MGSQPTRKTADEGTELLILGVTAGAREAVEQPLEPTLLGTLGSGEPRGAFLDIVGSEVLGEAGVEAGLEERKEEVENVDGKGVWSLITKPQ